MPLLFFVALLVFHHLVNPSLVSFTAQKTQAPNKPHKLLNNQVNKFPIYNLQARGNRNITEQNSEQKSVMIHKEWTVILLLNWRLWNKLL